MRFLVDENLSYQLVEFLRENKHDVISVLERFQGEDDLVILKSGLVHDRIIITADQDFGELVFKLKLKHAGVILLRTRDESSRSQIRLLKSFLKSKKINDIRSNFWVVSETGARRGRLFYL